MNVCEHVDDSELFVLYQNSVYLICDRNKSGNAYVEINYCPFCGCKFKEDLG